MSILLDSGGQHFLDVEPGSVRLGHAAGDKRSRLHEALRQHLHFETDMGTPAARRK